MANISRKILIPVKNEVPSGLINGTNAIYILAHTPIDGTLVVELNGLALTPGSGADYIVSGSTITFNKAPKIGNKILAHYWR